jgi:hypothetical protein
MVKPMDKLGEFEYPTLRTFKDALDLAKAALEKYSGIIPNADAARQLGYTVNEKESISGTIYAQFNDICMYGLLSREVRGALKATPLAKEALDPFDETKAALGKAKALRGIPLIEKAFRAWGGQIPADTELAAKLNELTGADWTECKSKAACVKIVINEAIPYLLMSKDTEGTQFQPLQHTEDRRENMQKSESSQQVPPSKLVGGIEEFVLGEGIRVYLPRENIKAAWEKTKKALKILVEESSGA